MNENKYEIVNTDFMFDCHQSIEDQINYYYERGFEFVQLLPNYGKGRCWLIFKRKD